jgi:hypothetical protein
MMLVVSDHEDTDKLREEQRRLEGSKTRRWRDMTGERAEMAEKPRPAEPPRRRRVRIGGQPKNAGGG